MKPQTEEEKIKYMTNIIIKNQQKELKLFINKQKAYGTHAIEDFGLDGIIIRMSDKMNRLRNLAYQKTSFDTPCNESVDDTLIDIANYANIALALREINKK